MVKVASENCKVQPRVSRIYEERRELPLYLSPLFYRWGRAKLFSRFYRPLAALSFLTLARGRVDNLDKEQR